MKRRLLIVISLLCLYIICHNTTPSTETTLVSPEPLAAKPTPRINTTTKNTSEDWYSLPLTKEQAEKLRGTGYGNTRPHSFAENQKLQAAQVKCDICGKHSDNGYNSACDYCRNAARIRGRTVF